MTGEHATSYSHCPECGDRLFPDGVHCCPDGFEPVVRLLDDDEVLEPRLGVATWPVEQDDQ